MTTSYCFAPTTRRLAIVVAVLLAAGAGVFGQQILTPPPNRRTVVADLIIDGNRKTSKQRILAEVRTRPGQEFSQETLQNDVIRVYKTNLFGNVQGRTESKGEDGVIVYISVVESPTVVQSILYNGAKHAKPEDLNNVINLRRGAPNMPNLNKMACQKIVQYYHENGRPFATCELVEGDKIDDSRVVFNITEGPKVKIGGVEFVGNSFVTDGRLATQVNSSRPILGIIGGGFNAAMIDADVGKLVEYYRSFGFLDVRISRELRYAPDLHNVTVVFHIQEGERYKVRSAVVEKVTQFPREEIDRLVKVRPGDYFNEVQIKRDAAAIQDYYGYTGRKADVEWRPEFLADEPGVVRVRYEVKQEQRPARVGQIFIVGNEVTRQNVILRELPIYPGQILTYPDLKVAEARLARLNIFQNNRDQGIYPMVEVLPPKDEDSEYRDVLVTVNETQTGSFMLGVGVNSNSGLAGSIVLNERNFDILRPPTSIDDFLSGRAFRGAGQEFRAEAVPGTQLQRYAVTWRDPRFLDSLYNLTVGGYYYQRIYNEYTESRLGSRITVGRQLNRFWSVNAGMRIENVGVHSVPFFAPEDFQKVEGNNFVAGFRGGVTRDSRDSFLRPTEGSLIDFSFEQVTGEFTYPVANAQANKYYTLWQRADGSGRHVLALRSQVGVTGTNTPVYDRFYAGGFQSIRGFQFRGVGPDVNGFKTGGDFMFLNSMEYQVPIKANDQIYLVGFVDSGTVEQRVELTNYRVSAGFGVRFVVPMMGPVPIALDFGFPIVKGPHDKEQVFAFWLGFFH